MLCWWPVGPTMLNWQTSQVAKERSRAQWEPWHFSVNESPEEKPSSSSGPWSLGRKFWLLVIQIMKVNSEETETEKRDMEWIRRHKWETLWVIRARARRWQSHHRDHSNGLFESYLTVGVERQCHQITPHWSQFLIPKQDSPQQFPKWRLTFVLQFRFPEPLLPQNPCKSSLRPEAGHSCSCGETEVENQAYKEAELREAERIEDLECSGKKKTN